MLLHLLYFDQINPVLINNKNKKNPKNGKKLNIKKPLKKFTNQ